jgi:hypothetical protein
MQLNRRKTDLEYFHPAHDHAVGRPLHRFAGGPRGGARAVLHLGMLLFLTILI